MTQRTTILLSESEFSLRLSAVAREMRSASVDTMVLTDSANLFYLTGRVFCGWAVVNVSGTESSALFFVRRPTGLEGCVAVRKPEDIPSHIKFGQKVALELDTASYSTVRRLKRAFGLEAEPADASAVMRAVRAVKTPAEIAMIRRSAERHERVYQMVPKLFHEGMTDLELQIEIERVSRLEGSLGQFRISGDTMEIYMGNVLAGNNADNPTPYDFAMGGEGISPSLPVGANGTTIEEGSTVMVDMNGNFTGYMTDMTRVYSLGSISDKAMRAHQCSVDICAEFSRRARPGVAASDLYEMAAEMAREAGLEPYFMGHRQKAAFVGHGVGIEINESPVIAPRSKNILAEGNVIALEPKFVIPGTGAVGIENTYLITADGAECLTNAPEQIINLQ